VCSREISQWQQFVLSVCRGNCFTPLCQNKPYANTSFSRPNSNYFFNNATCFIKNVNQKGDFRVSCNALHPLPFLAFQFPPLFVENVALTLTRGLLMCVCVCAHCEENLLWQWSHFTRASFSSCVNSAAAATCECKRNEWAMLHYHCELKWRNSMNINIVCMCWEDERARINKINDDNRIRKFRRWVNSISLNEARAGCLDAGRFFERVDWI
jgi:hypothetical protein